MDTRISGKTRLLAVIGTPIKHTGSPVIYNFCFDHYGIDAVYLAFECDALQVKDTIDAVKRLNIRGVNVTMPCKTEVVKYMDRLSMAARLCGAVNTIVNDNGVLTGHITDGCGVVLDLKDHGISVKGKKITLLGAGGAASAIMVQCALDGADEIAVFNRGEQGLEKMREIGRKMQKENIACKLKFHLTSENEYMHDVIRTSDILINATSVGMKPMAEGKSIVTDLTVFHENLVVYDVVYNPAVTRLMEDALSNGCKKEHVIGGKGMLMWQAAGAFKLYTGLDMPAEELKTFLNGRVSSEERILSDIAENVPFEK